MRKLISLGAAVAALALAATGASATELVTNGDFASGDFSGWTLFTTGGGTLGFAPDPRVTSFDVTGGGASDAAEFQVGDAHSAGSQQGGGIFQSIHTASGLLTFGADWAALGGLGGENASGGVFSVLLDGISLDSFDTGDTGGFPTVVRGGLSFSTTVTAGSHILSLQATRPFTDGPYFHYTPLQYFDNVSAVQSGGGVPEPETWSLMIAGFGLAGGMLRRRTRAALSA
jgi:hypothetical protein